MHFAAENLSKFQKYPDHKSALEGCSTEKHSFQSLYYHKLGSSEEDVLIADFRWDPELMWLVFCVFCDRHIVEVLQFWQ